MSGNGLPETVDSFIFFNERDCTSEAKSEVGNGIESVRRGVRMCMSEGDGVRSEGEGVGVKVRVWRSEGEGVGSEGDGVGGEIDMWVCQAGVSDFE